MTNRHPIFRSNVRRPFAGGTGNAQAGPSEERQQAEDESNISQARQLMVKGLLEREGPLGMTIAEVGKAAGWHHGQASNALSVMDRAGDIVRLDERREKQSVYVLEMFRAGRPLGAHRKSSADKVREELVEAQITISNQVEALAQAGRHIRDVEVALRVQVDATADCINQRESALRRARAAVEALVAEQDRVTEMDREISAHRVDRALRMQLDDRERLELSNMDARLQNASSTAGDEDITVPLDSLRVVYAIARRTTSAS